MLSTPTSEKLSKPFSFMFILFTTVLFIIPATYSFQLHPRLSSIHNINHHQKWHPSSMLSSSSSSNNEFDYDLAIIGAGPVGVQAALTAASSQHNKKVCLIDAPRESGMLYNEATNQDLSIGGPTGLFSKALRDTSKRINVNTLRGMGLREESCWNEVLSSCVDLASSNAMDVRRQLDFAGVDYLEGFAAFTTTNDDGESNNGSSRYDLSITKSSNDNKESTSILKAHKILIATGSTPFQPKGIPFDGKRIFDSDSINTLSYLPKSIAITGSGIIAIEFAKIFRNLGADVTLIIRDNVPRNALMKIGLDKDIAATLVADLVRSGIKIERGAQVSSFDVPADNTRSPITITLEGKNGVARPTGAITEAKCDAYLAAVGRTPNTKKLNLDAAGIEVDEYGGLKVNSNLQTTADGGNVYGAGDVLGRPFLASTGVAQALAAVRHMFSDDDDDDSIADGEKEEEEAGASPSSSKNESNEQELCVDGDLSKTGAKFDPTSLASNPFAFPIGVWSSPEAAYYGLSAQQAQELGIDAGEGIALYCECLRGLVFSPNGLLKLVFEKPAGRIVGVHICGTDACELIHYGMELVKAKRTIKDIIENVYSAVTFHEMYRIAAMAAVDEVGARKRRAAAGKALAEQNRAKRQVD